MTFHQRMQRKEPLVFECLLRRHAFSMDFLLFSRPEGLSSMSSHGPLFTAKNSPFHPNSCNDFLSLPENFKIIYPR